VSRISEVTVVIPTHNRLELVQRTLHSVLAQQKVSLDVVVVDDGGSDGTYEALRHSVPANVLVLRNSQPKGVSAARNAGLSKVETGWVAFVDDDDIWAPNKLQAQLSALRETPEARWSCVDALHVDDELNVKVRATSPGTGDISSTMLRNQVIPGGGSGVLVDCHLATHVGGFDESMSILADWDFYLRLSLESPIAAASQPLVGYYVHADSMYHNPAGLLRELLFMEKKYQRLADGRSFCFDRVFWYTRLARMARAQGDWGTTRLVLTRGAREVGLVAIVAEAARWAWQRRRRTVGSDEGEPDGEANWLLGYRRWPEHG
jgi:glycosyltransferase involved in cell wall biosynthesis